MRAALYIHDNYVLFEVVLSRYFLGTKGEVVVVSSDGRPHRSMEGFLTAADMRLDELDLASIDAFILPGGREEDIADHAGLRAALRELDARGCIIAAICGGPLQLARAGLLDGRQFTSSGRWWRANIAHVVREPSDLNLAFRYALKIANNYLLHGMKHAH